MKTIHYSMGTKPCIDSRYITHPLHYTITTVPCTPASNLSSMNALNGAHPVPGPTMMAGLCRNLVNASVPGTIHTGTVTPVEGSNEASHVEHTP